MLESCRLAWKMSHTWGEAGRHPAAPRLHHFWWDRGIARPSDVALLLPCPRCTLHAL